MRRLLLPLLLAGASFFAWGADARTITIESARSTEYVKTPGSGVPASGEAAAAPETQEESGTAPLPLPAPEELIRFSGDVSIVVTEGQSVSRIKADMIVYDKTRETLEARGNVNYEHTVGKSGSETFRGEALLFNIRKQEGIFLKGAVKQDSGRKDSDPYIIQAEVTGRDSGSTIAFRKGVLTTCEAEDPHWSISASRIWLLPGNEIALLNAVFFIGPLPVLYIPAFYYPSDEMVLHPVFGFRNREGYFIQTTSYLAGRKPLASKTSSSGTSFADFLQGDSLKEQKRDGLFLRNLDTDATGGNSDYLKLMADAYSSLGGMVGIDGSFTTTGYVKTVAFSGYLGLSRTLYDPSSGTVLYSTYDDEGNQNSDSGWFFGNRLPFRFKTNFSMRMDKSPFQLTVTMPFLSDAYFRRDFLDRKEDLNWFSLLTDQADLALGSSLGTESSFTWNASGSVRPDVAAASPWLTSFSVSNLSGLLTFNEKHNTDVTDSDSPGYYFFYPELIKPELRLSLGGTLISSKPVKKAESGRDPVKGTDLSGLANPFKDAGAGEAVQAPQADTGAIERFIPKNAAGASASATAAPAGWDYAVTWSLDPGVLEEIRYNPSDWTEPADIDWNSYTSVYYQLKAAGKIQGNLSYDTSLFSLSSGINFSGIKQDHPWWSSDSVETTKNTALLSDYKASVFTLSSVSSFKLNPFYRMTLLKPVSFSWNFTGDVVRNAFDGTVTDPSWTVEPFKWDKDYVDAHAASAVFGLALAGHEQKITVSSNLPPLLESWTGNASFGWSFVSLSMGSRLYAKEDASKKWYWDPWRTSVSWILPYNVTLAQEFVYDIENDMPSRLNLTAGFGLLSAYYTLNSAVPYVLDQTAGGWVTDGTEKKFIPTAAGFTFGTSSKPLLLYAWKNRIQLKGSFTSNLKFNLGKLTDSSFEFSPTLTFKVTDFLDLSFSSTSRNEVIARYFQDWMNLPEPLPGETNILTDLVKSFSFADRTARTETGFKLKSLNLELTHYLHDWTMNFKTAVQPEFNDDTKKYEFVPTITFVVQWKPISDIKTTVKSEDGTFSLNTTDDTDDTSN